MPAIGRATLSTGFLMDKKNLLLSKDAFGTALLISALDDFGPELLEWEPETIELELRTKYQVVPLSSSLDRLHAAASLLSSTLFFQSITAFNAICSTLSFDEPVEGEFYPASLPEVVWGLTEARLLLGSEGGAEEGFSRNIRLYVGKLLEGEGILDPPEIMSFAQLTRLDTLDTQMIADLPDITLMFEANQSDSKKELDEYALARAYEMFRQIGSLDLDTTNLSEFKTMSKKFLGEEIFDA